jgi:uncharacterized membrane protein YdbT with pleckstrin-like domain
VTVATDPQPQDRNLALHAEGPTSGVVRLPVEALVPAHLLDGGEVVLFAIKPSPWFVLIVSLRWLAVAILLGILANRDLLPSGVRWYLYQSAVAVAGFRLGWAILEWVSRLYVLTNHRVMRIRGVFYVELFECTLSKLQNTYATFSLAERLTRTGTITFQTAAAGGGPGGTASWRIVSRPLEVHQKLREAIRREQNRGNNGL